MSYFRTCEYCGDNLDPGERCKCREEKEPVKAVPQKIEVCPKESGRRVSRALCV